MADIREYVDIEAGLHKRLTRSWGTYASAAYAEITEAVAAQDWVTAYALAQALDMTDIAEEAKDYVSACLKTAALYGSRSAQGNVSFLASLDFRRVIERAVGTFMRSVEFNASTFVQDKAAQLIAQAQATAEADLVQKAAKPRFVREFVSFQEEGDAMLQLISSLHTSRLSTWGFTAEADVMGYKEYELSAVLDGRTSDFCRLIHGKRFKVADARKSIVQILEVENPDDVKTLQPWPKQNKAALEEFATLSPKELTARNLHIPPFHPMCRTMLVQVGQAPKIGKPKRVKPSKPAPETESPVTAPGPVQVPDAPTEPVPVGSIPFVPPGAAPAPPPKKFKPVKPKAKPALLPEEAVSEEAFKALGVRVSPSNVQHWNDYVGVSPIDILSAFTGYSPKQIADKVMGKAFKSVLFHQNGDISLKFKAPVGSASYQGKMTFNPYSGVLYKDHGDFIRAEKADALKFFAQLEVQQLVVAQSIAAESLVVGVGVGQAVAFARMGYAPTDVEWAFIRQDLLELVGGDLADAFKALPKTRQQSVMLLLSSKDPRALRALADINGPFIRSLLRDVEFEGVLDLTDAAVMVKHTEEL